MTHEKKPSLLLPMLIGAAALGGIIWAVARPDGGGGPPPVAPVTEDMAGPERDALELTRNPRDVRAMEAGVNLIQKKNEVRTAVNVAALTAEMTVSDAAFDAAWNAMLPADRQSKTVDELASIVLSSVGGE